MSSDYQPPAWSTPPPPRGEFTLEILKDGTIVGTHELKGKDYFILGRQRDAVDFPMDHLSVSRRHAVLNYRDDGALMLLDLNSAQGTRLNKERIAPNSYRQVFSGDIIQFAASTRKYIANGPPEQSREEYDSENLAKYRAQLVAKTQRAEKRKHQQEEMMEKQRKQEEEEANKGVSWGFDDDAVDDLEDIDGEGRKSSAQSQEGHGSNSDEACSARWRSGGAKRDDDDDDDREQSSGNCSRRRMPEYLRKDQNYDRKYGTVYSADIDESQVSDKDKALLEKILKKEKKIQNMQEEIKRIYMKENSQENGLTEGQVAVVTRNDAQIEALSADIDGLKKQIEDKNLQRKMGSSAGEGDKAGGNSGRLGGKRRRGSSGDDEEDDMIDMTSETADVRVNWRLRKKLAAKSHQQIGMHQQNLQQSLQQQQHHKQAALSYEEIKREVDRIEDILTLTENEAERLRSEAEAEFSNHAGGAAAGSGEDNLRDVMMMDRAKENAQKLRKIASERAENELKLQRMRKLLKVATPALQSLISAGSDRADRPPMKFRSPSIDSSNDTCLSVHVVPPTAALVQEPNAGKENLSDAGIAGQRDSVNASIAKSVSSAVQPEQQQQPQQQQKLKTEEGIENPTDNNPSVVVPTPEAVSLDRFRRFVEEERAREAEQRNGAGYLGASSSVTASASTSAVNARSTVLRPSPQTAPSSSSSLSALSELSSSKGVAATNPALVTHDAIYAPAKRYSVSVDRDANTGEGNNDLIGSRNSSCKHTGRRSEGMSKIDHHVDKEWSNLHTAGPSSVETAPKSTGKSSTATTATSKSNRSSSSISSSRSGTKGMLEGGELAWVPPQGQTGDGRTSLNDKLGY